MSPGCCDIRSWLPIKLTRHEAAAGGISDPSRWWPRTAFSDCAWLQRGIVTSRRANDCARRLRGYEKISRAVTCAKHYSFNTRCKNVYLCSQITWLLLD
jgi:hypothetical protein